MKPIPVKISESKYSAGPGLEKKYIKKVIMATNQKLIPDVISSQLFLVDGQNLEFMRLLDSFFQDEMKADPDFKERVRSRFSREQLKVLVEGSKDVQ